MGDLKYVGQPCVRIDGKVKVSGAAQFILAFTQSKGQAVLEHLSKEKQDAIIRLTWEPNL